ncbi:Acetyl xylan esterase [hydrothermal vent metagenome]|uniref:Acetyl xylan esterase n=1 Tax=hydrothermal vent metagenome TaxID=652676 RepID=A0A3B0V825_9ZZZZ
MPFFDMPQNELETYLPQRKEPADFDDFWQKTLAEAAQFSLNAQFDPVDEGLQTIDAYDVTFAGFGGQAVKGWFLLPRHRSGPLPCVVQYLGYSGGRGFIYDLLTWPTLGFAYFIMDTRGQGWSDYRPGATFDHAPQGTGPHVPGFMTQGILDPHTYYYRRVFVDAIRALALVREQPAVQPERIAITGASQGGGITLAVAGLDTAVPLAMPEVPFLCHYRHATETVNTEPYNEIVRFCASHRDKVGTVFRTLSYFDGVNFATRAKARALFSVGLMDDICPPSTVYAAYNHYAGPKEMAVYSYNNHEGGGPFHLQMQANLLRDLWL